ncbi:flavin reductase family protein [Streptomyces sp. NPDC002889]|uniref:flavin reductase family protein n=1 Tax=Streptomyces sp. NPDC002889 TaxID=3364669 RepID=UPI0036956995
MPVQQSQTAPLVTTAAFRDGMALLSAPVTIVATRDADGRPWGFTASAVSSLSLDPPLLLVGIARSSSCYEAFAQAAEFTVSMLSWDHVGLAETFATSGIDRFSGTDQVQDGDGLPYVRDAIGHFRCSLAQRVDAGDHELLIGAVHEVTVRGGRPLVRYQRRFATVG